VTREQAEALAARLNREAEDREAYERVARQSGDRWEVVKIRVPGELRAGPLRETISADEKPPQPDDPRSAAQRNAPGARG
jgi:hypothetical protein